MDRTDAYRDDQAGYPGLALTLQHSDSVIRVVDPADPDGDAWIRGEYGDDWVAALMDGPGCPMSVWWELCQGCGARCGAEAHPAGERFCQSCKVERGLIAPPEDHPDI